MRLMASAMPSASTAVALILGLTALEARAQEVVVTFPATFQGPGVWFQNDVRVNGTAGIVDLTGEGGDLENGQPLPIGAARLTTDADNASKAEVGVPDAYGIVDDILASLEVFYSYYKVDNGPNEFAAPSIKLAFSDAACDDPASLGDCGGTLTYEPYWNQASAPGFAVAPPTGAWQDVVIDATTGLFWWSGGFGQPNSFGGPPLRTLDEWRSVLSSDFGTAELYLVSVGVGTFNQNQIGYFDDVQISHGFDGGFAAWYDFEPAVGPPTDKDACKKGGWMDFNNPPFENQGRCVSFVASSGRSGPKD